MVYVLEVTPIKTEDFTQYLAALRTQVAKHGRDRVNYRPTEDLSMLGFQSPDGWWVVPVITVRASCAAEVGAWQYKNRKATAAGRYAKRESSEGIFIDWFSAKLLTAITDGERLRSQGGLS